MATRPLEARSLMDEFLPNHDFSAAYALSINAPSSVVCECLLRSDFNELWLVRLLMSIRSGKWLPRNRMPGDLRQQLQGTGFVILGEVPNEEIVVNAFKVQVGVMEPLRRQGLSGNSACSFSERFEQRPELRAQMQFLGLLPQQSTRIGSRL
jgi:hypothetical protein